MRATQILLYMVPPRRPCGHLDGHVPRGRQALAYRRYRLPGPDGHHQTPSAAQEGRANSSSYDDTTSTAAGSCPRLIMVRTSSMIPYSLASSAVRNLSRSMSRRTLDRKSVV